MSLRGSLLPFVCAASCLTSTLAWAADLPAPVDARVVDERPATTQERVYPMGPLRKISGRLRMDDKVESRGQVSSITYELPQERTAREAFTEAREALQQAGDYPLFWCQGRDCGEASLWANEVFGNARLNGGDEQQAFILLRRSAQQANTLVALYSVTRGNRRAYLHVEAFVAERPLGELLPTPGTVLRELRDTGKLDYPDLQAPQAAWVALLARSLNLDSTLRVSLGGSEAGAWREQLVAAGVRAARLEADEAPSDGGLHLELIR
ncbi:DUF4892 domain-containing protein [Pseudomonas sp. Marseille-QA0332]